MTAVYYGCRKELINVKENIHYTPKIGETMRYVGEIIVYFFLVKIDNINIGLKFLKRIVYKFRNFCQFLTRIVFLQSVGQNSEYRDDGVGKATTSIFRKLGNQHLLTKKYQ